MTNAGYVYWQVRFKIVGSDVEFYLNSYSQSATVYQLFTKKEAEEFRDYLLTRTDIKSALVHLENPSPGVL